MQSCQKGSGGKEGTEVVRPSDARPLGVPGRVTIAWRGTKERGAWSVFLLLFSHRYGRLWWKLSRKISLQGVLYHVIDDKDRNYSRGEINGVTDGCIR